jgi:hypothetical protein
LKTGVNALMCRTSTSWWRGIKEVVDGRDKPGHDNDIF